MPGSGESPADDQASATEVADRARLAWRVVSFVALFAGLVMLVQVWNWVPNDDDFAYVLTARHLLTTGSYRLHDWATAAIIPQAWMGNLFATLFGDRFLVYIAVSLMLAAAAGIGLYLLARDLRLSRTVSFVAAVSFLFCPLMIRSAFTYMSDVPFTAFLVLAFFFYHRGWTRQQLRWTLGGSLCAAAAMLTRQFGVLILVGLAISWLLGIRAARVSKRPLRFSAQLATAAVLPLAALAYQLILAQSTPSWAQLYSIARLQTHLLESWPALLVSVAWRLTMIAQYVALFLSPIVLALMYTSAARMVRDVRHRAWPIPGDRMVAGLMMTMIGLAWYQYTFGKGPVLQPTSEGYFDFLMGLGVSLRLLLTLATMFGGTLILATVIRHYRRHSERSASVFNGTGIIEWTSLGLLGFHLFFFQIYDEYLLDLLPLATLFLAWSCRETIERYPRRFLAGVATLAVLSGFWVRGVIEESRAAWSAGEYLVSRGVPIDKIGNRWYWNSYHGEFDRFLIEVDRRMLPTLGLYFDYLRRLDMEQHEYFVAERRDAVPVHGQLAIDPQPQATFPYTDSWLRQRSVSIWKASR